VEERERFLKVDMGTNTKMSKQEVGCMLNHRSRENVPGFLRTCRLLSPSQVHGVCIHNSSSQAYETTPQLTCKEEIVPSYRGNIFQLCQTFQMKKRNWA
jgi:hypothetical protein